MLEYLTRIKPRILELAIGVKSDVKSAQFDCIPWNVNCLPSCQQVHSKLEISVIPGIFEIAERCGRQ